MGPEHRYLYKDEKYISPLLKYSKRMEGNGLRFLKDLNTLLELDIIASGGSGLASISALQKLEELSLTCATKDIIDFSSLKKLRKCYLYWWPGVKSVLECHGLEDVYFDNLKLKDYSDILKLRKLKTLTIANSPLVSIDWIKELHGLRSVSFLNCRRIESFTAIGFLEQIEKLRISGCKQLRELSFVRNCRALKVLDISDCGLVESLAPLENLVNLQSVAFAGKTNVVDGSLEVLSKLPKMAMLMFQERRHYTHRLIKKWNWNNYNKPDVLLEAKSTTLSFPAKNVPVNR